MKYNTYYPVAIYQMLQAFKTHITPSQAIDPLTHPKDLRKSWIYHLLFLNAVAEASGGASNYLVRNNIVQYASHGMRILLMARSMIEEPNIFNKRKS